MYDYIAHIESKLPEIFDDWFDRELSIINPLHIRYIGLRQHPLDKTQVAVYQVRVWAPELVLETDYDWAGSGNIREQRYTTVFLPRNLEICINVLGEVVSAELV